MSDSSQQSVMQIIQNFCISESLGKLGQTLIPSTVAPVAGSAAMYIIHFAASTFLPTSNPLVKVIFNGITFYVAKNISGRFQQFLTDNSALIGRTMGTCAIAVGTAAHTTVVDALKPDGFITKTAEQIQIATSSVARQALQPDGVIAKTLGTAHAAANSAISGFTTKTQPLPVDESSDDKSDNEFYLLGEDGTLTPANVQVGKVLVAPTESTTSAASAVSEPVSENPKASASDSTQSAVLLQIPTDLITPDVTPSAPAVIFAAVAAQETHKTTAELSAEASIIGEPPAAPLQPETTNTTKKKNKKK